MSTPRLSARKYKWGVLGNRDAPLAFKLSRRHVSAVRGETAHHLRPRLSVCHVLEIILSGGDRQLGARNVSAMMSLLGRILVVTLIGAGVHALASAPIPSGHTRADAVGWSTWGGNPAHTRAVDAEVRPPLRTAWTSRVYGVSRKGDDQLDLLVADSQRVYCQVRQNDHSTKRAACPPVIVRR